MALSVEREREREKKRKKNAYRTRGRITLAHAREIFDAVSAVINNAARGGEPREKIADPWGWEEGATTRHNTEEDISGQLRNQAAAADSPDADVRATVRCKRCLTVHPVARLRTAAANVLAPTSKPRIGFASANETHVANLRGQSTAPRIDPLLSGQFPNQTPRHWNWGW